MSGFLKWAGGKRWLAAQNAHKAFPTFDRYVEPFLGSAAIFFAVAPDRALLSDLNSHLINVYEQVRIQPGALANALQHYQLSHSSAFYYNERDTIYEDPIKRAAQFLYLNRTCWNGLYRVNKNGKFNVPIGTKTAIFYSEEEFVAAAVLLKNANILCADFEKIIDQCGYGDFIFCDPPYTVKHNMNGFVKYNESIFSWNDQERLAAALQRANVRGANFFVTNADHESVRDLYHKFSTVSRRSRSSVISGLNKGRSIITEAEFRSY